MSQPCYRIDSGGAVLVVVHVQPGAKVTEVSGLHGDALKVRLAAPAIDGKANAALVALFSARLKVPRANVELAVGAASRRKILRIVGLTDAAVATLQAWAEQS
jgi:uncharacterized protein